MFTVVIAEQELIESMEEYKIFLRPFLTKSKVKLCAWDTATASNNLGDMVPELVETVGSIREWRAVVVCDERGLSRKNPFDLVEYKKPPRKIVEAPPGVSELEPLKEYLGRVRETKFAAYDQAAKQPLTRLMAYLCQTPIVSPMKDAGDHVNRGSNGVPVIREKPKTEDPREPEDPNDRYALEDERTINRYQADAAQKESLEFEEYILEGERREMLLRSINGGKPLEIAAPMNVICVARRTCAETEYDIDRAWTAHIELQYSEFFDWNLYFDKMRYLVFDLLPRNHRNYSSDYIKFLYVLMLLANHEIPADSLQPNRVYQLNCENDESALVRLMSRYDAKLAATDTMLQGMYHKLEMKTKDHLTDREVEEIFCSGIKVPVVVSGQDTNRGDLYASMKLGLATDCPEEEIYAWDSYYTNARGELLRYLKQHPRALRRATDTFRDMDQADTDKVPLLNSYQLEDLEEYVGKEEIAMVEIPTRNLDDTDEVLVRTDQANLRVQKKIETRMTRRFTVLLGGTILLLLLLSFLPMLFGQIRSAGNVLISLGIMLVAVLLLAVVGLICLLVLRRALKKRYQWFNGEMQGVVSEVDDSLSRFSDYLSHACNVMRGFSVLNFSRAYEDPDTTQMHVLKKHMIDIRAARAYLKEVYGGFLDGKTCAEEVPPYDFNFERAVDYQYPLPYTDEMKCDITYMQPGSSIQVPVDFICAITVKREELYD